MVSLRPAVAPVHLMHLARLALVPASGMMLWLVAVWPVASSTVAGIFYALTVLLHLACPRMRSSDLSAAVAVCATLLAFLPGEPSGAAMLRWLWTLAAIGLAVVPMKTSRMRARMTREPYRPLRRPDRRGRAPAETVVSHTDPAPPIRLAPTPAGRRRLTA